jgi:hypothetical protein
MTVPFFCALLLLSYVATLLQSGWISAIFPSALKPDLMLIFVIYVGTLPYLLPGAALIVLSGLGYELFSGGPAGFFLLIHLILFFLLQFLAKIIIIGQSLSFRLLLVFLGHILQYFLFVFLPFVFGIGPHLSFPGWTWILPQAALTSLAGWPVWILFNKVEALPRMAPPPKSA